MTAKELLKKQTADAFSEYEMSLVRSVRGLTGEEASWKPNAETGTIEEILHHLAWCKIRYAKQAFGPCDVPDDVPTGDLERTRAWLGETHAHLAKCLEEIAPKALDEPVPTKFHGESAAHLFWVLLIHDLSHAGQIAIVRREYRQRGCLNGSGSAATEAGLPSGWRAAGGQWTMDGSVRILGRSAGNAYLYREQEHADDLRVAATLQAVAGGEITVWICGSPERTEMDGYTLAVSAERAKMQRCGEDVAGDPSVTIQPGRDYAIAFERRGAKLRGFLDGATEPFIEWADPEPLRGEGHRTLGFYVWDGTLAVSNVTVRRLAD